MLSWLVQRFSSSIPSLDARLATPVGFFELLLVTVELSHLGWLGEPGACNCDSNTQHIGQTNKQVSTSQMLRQYYLQQLFNCHHIRVCHALLTQSHYRQLTTMESHAPIAFDANLANALDIPLASSELTELSEFNLITTPVSLTAHSTDLHHDFLDHSTVNSDATVPFGFYPGLASTSDESSTSTAGVKSNLTDFNFNGFDFTCWNTGTVPHDFSTPSLSFQGIPAPYEQSWTGNSAKHQ
ncbi:hypothetical protein H0H92_015851 [Tricholoma furcatifolium]|nr:hypothetical protein H0H92_015851 [Tricholoma furcatifolium]